MHNAIRQSLKKVLPLALSTALLVQPGLAASRPTVPHGWTSPFSDVQEGSWFYPFVGALNSQGVIQGYDNGRFGPNDITRAGDSMIMVLKAAGSGIQAAPNGTHYASGYAGYAVDQGWLTRDQVPEDLDKSVSRLFIAQLAAKALGLIPAAAPSPFADTDDGYVTALYQRGIVAGTQAGDRLLFQPDSSITRAELSAIVWQIQEYGRRIYFGTYVLDVLDGVPASGWNESLFTLEGDRMTYSADGVSTALGIDVSYHQGVIDWKRVAADGIEFAMIRAGGRYYQSGGIFEDTQFRANLQGAVDAGLDTGVYFFSQAITEAEALEEAAFLLSLLEDFDFSGPVVFDWENITYDTARTDGLTSDTITAMARAFCSAVEKAGYRPMIYFNQYIGYLLYHLDEVARYPFWLAQYGDVPGFYYDFQIWQYTDSGRVDGVEGPVDMNIRIQPR